MEKFKTGKKFLSLLLTLCMVMSLCTVLTMTASASGLSGGVLTIH